MERIRRRLGGQLFALESEFYDVGRQGTFQDLRDLRGIAALDARVGHLEALAKLLHGRTGELLVGRQDFPWRHPGEFGRKLGEGVDFGGAKLAGRDIQIGKAPARAPRLGHHRRQVAGALGIEDLVIDHHAGGDNLHDVPFDQAFGGLGILDLLADDYFEALLGEPSSQDPQPSD